MGVDLFLLEGGRWIFGNVNKLDSSWKHKNWTKYEKVLWSYIQPEKRGVHVGAGLMGKLSTYFPRLLQGKTLVDSTDCNKIVTIFLMSKVNRGRTPMAMGTEKGKGLCWVRVATRLLVGEVPLGCPGLSTGRSKDSCCCKALNRCFHLVGMPGSQLHSGSWDRCAPAARDWGLGVSRFLVRDQIRRLTGQEQGPRVPKSWVPTPTWLLKLLCELE